MIIERTDKEVIIRLPANIDVEELQDTINYSRYKEISSMFEAISQEEIDEFSNSINSKWWSENKHKFIK